MIPAEVQSVAKLTVEKLRIERAKGVTTPQNPKTGATIIQEYNRRFEASVREK